MLTLISILFTSIFVSAAPTCQDLFAVEIYGQIRKSFDHSTHYDVLVNDQAPTKDQCHLRHCHLYAWTSHLERNGGPPISNAFLDYVYIYQKAQRAIDEGAKDFEQNLWSPPVPSRQFITKYGLIPMGVWEPRVKLPGEPNYSTIMQSLDNIILQSHWQRDQLPEASAKERADIVAAAHRQVYALMDNIFGAPPESFSYRGRSYTPKTFAEEYYPEFDKPIVYAMVRTDDSQRSNFSESKVAGIYLTVAEMENMIRKVLDSGQPVYLTYEHYRQYVEAKSGIMSVDAFIYPALITPITREQKKAHARHHGHAVLIVGYERDVVNGGVRKWKIKNSWGPNLGDQGYYHMYSDYFRAFVSNISFVNEGHIPLPAR